jgi:hypothetical protein
MRINTDIHPTSHMLSKTMPQAYPISLREHLSHHQIPTNSTRACNYLTDVASPSLATITTTHAHLAKYAQFFNYEDNASILQLDDTDIIRATTPLEETTHLANAICATNTHLTTQEATMTLKDISLVHALIHNLQTSTHSDTTLPSNTYTRPFASPHPFLATSPSWMPVQLTTYPQESLPLGPPDGSFPTSPMRYVRK